MKKNNAGMFLAIVIISASCVTGCASSGGGRVIETEQLPALALGVGLVAMDVRAIIEAETPTLDMVTLLIEDMEAILPLINDQDSRDRLARIINDIRAVAHTALLVKALLSGSVEELRALRDALIVRR